MSGNKTIADRAEDLEQRLAAHLRKITSLVNQFTGRRYAPNLEARVTAEGIAGSIQGCEELMGHAEQELDLLIFSGGISPE